MQIDVKGVLSLWGGYVRFTDCKGYPTMQAFMRESPQERTKQRYLARLDDDTLEKVDRQMRKLQANDKRQFDVLFYKYAVGLENKQVWQKLSLSKTSYHTELLLAERFMEGALAGSEIRLFL
ncbi:antiterminator Q family protein [Mannheimia haemolytica]|uniref:Phage antitermination protein Q n=2 Tax=Mannheimia haemolytica TaxID=75985 RepID=A0A378N9X9_MANHA|nr:antiterminator Q family protein [Mannheimia haemolytica]MDW1110253.1 antiterminator Q family protein [Mannheimia haemolytica]MDW1112793.1 antiterminator Q family protein [Mannheimia haemolytica]MDW1133206.1 antiterminator Q family protein [Mannheimia haemolytica]MDW1146037.1 antiterminator Q family protein [Mannheimia haemolytica]MDW1156108.1 antiterminator Q family protein [Mannheimia haemolytica]